MFTFLTGERLKSVSKYFSKVTPPAKVAAGVAKPGPRREPGVVFRDGKLVFLAEHRGSNPLPGVS